MPVQPPPLMITFLSVSRTTPTTTIMLTKKKKSQKPKIPDTLSIKEAVAKTKHLAINNLVDDLANVVGSIFFQNAKDQLEYKDHALAYHYCLFFIFCGFNQGELDVLSSTSLPFFYGKCDKDRKKALRDAFKSAYYYLKPELIENIIGKANLWLEIPARNNYHNKYYLAR